MMNGKVRAFNGDMGMAMSVFKDMVGKVRFVFADPPYKITQARYDKEGFDYKAMWEVIQKMLCPYGVVAVTCSLTAAVEIMRVAPAGWYRYDLVWHKTTPTGFLNAKKAPLRNHELILIFSPMPLGKHTYNPQKTYGHVRKVSKASSKAGCKETELYGKTGLTTYDSTERYPLSVMTFKTDRQKISRPSQPEAGGVIKIPDTGIHESGRYGNGSGSRERNDRDSGLRGGKGLPACGDRPSIL